VPLQGDISVLQALALTGGLTEYAKSGDIRVLRKTSSGVETIPFRYKDALRGDAKALVYLRPGDTVIVP
jgi:polysaccharide export outer membrane protein